ncbi:MAG TPA: S53 family peptidase [Mycobacteriales bacterium]
MRPSRTSLSLLAVAGATALVAGTAGAAVAAGRTAPARVPVAGGSAVALTGATVTGPASAAHVPVDLVLATRDVAAQDALIASGASLTPAEYAQRFGATAAQVDQVTAWARGAGLTVTPVDGGQILALDGSAAQVGRAFGTTLQTVAFAGGRTGLRPSTAATLPASIAPLVAGVTGLSEVGAMHLQERTALSFPASYTPQQISAIYGAGSAHTGSGVPVAVIASGPLGQVEKDLRTFETTYGLPQTPWQTVLAPSAGTDTSGQDEYDLDTQYATSQAPDASQLYVYDGPDLADATIVTEIGTWVSQDLTRQASFSAGECEVLAQVGGLQSSLDTVLRQAAVQGQTLFTSSGDTGAFCPLPVVGVNGVPAGLPGDNYPAASPYAIGVGGTTVLDPSTPTEIAWYAGGGGPSLFESVPTWQQNAGGSFVGVRRGVPDVALDADPNSGYDVVVSGTVETIGGTSASAPAWQGFWARAQSAHGNALGFAGPILYGLPAAAFHDITLGVNGIYPATPGYDYDTGRGTPVVSVLAASS